MSDPGQQAPTQQPAPAAPPGAPDVPDMGGLLPHMESGLQRQMTMYDKIKEAKGKASVMREQLDELVKLGDMVQIDDLVESAAKLVSKGFAAAEIAGILSEAPEQGEQLKAWILQKDAILKTQEQQLSQMAAATRHDMGVAAVRLMGAHSMATLHGFPVPGAAGKPSSMGPTAGAANDLMAGGSPGSAPATAPSDEENALGASPNG